jgi:hypothetical protein
MNKRTTTTIKTYLLSGAFLFALLLLVIKIVPPAVGQQMNDKKSLAPVVSKSPQSSSEMRASGASSQLLPELLPRDKEVDLALGAAPEHLRKSAGVYVLERNGFVKARDSANGFTCIINRDHPLNQKPVCFDAEGTATILPKILRVGELLMQGKPMSEINAEIAEGFRTGKYISPRRTGVAYMLSGDVRSFNSRTGKVESFPPHVMFYAPNLTNADLGITSEALAKDPSLPFVAYQGPHGFIIVLAGNKQKITNEHEH